MEPFSALLALCVGSSPVPGEFPSQSPVTQSFDIFFDYTLNKRLSKQSWGWWFETPSRSLWRHCTDLSLSECYKFIKEDILKACRKLACVKGPCILLGPSALPPPAILAATWAWARDSILSGQKRAIVRVIRAPNHNRVKNRKKVESIAFSEICYFRVYFMSDVYP